MVVTTTIYVICSYYSNVYRLIGDNYGLNSTGVLLETTFGMIMFILLLIALDRRVKTRTRRNITKIRVFPLLDRIHESIGSVMDHKIPE